jgi:hypothetical protein
MLSDYIQSVYIPSDYIYLDYMQSDYASSDSKTDAKHCTTTEFMSIYVCT